MLKNRIKALNKYIEYESSKELENTEVGSFGAKYMIEVARTSKLDIVRKRIERK